MDLFVKIELLHLALSDNSIQSPLQHWTLYELSSAATATCSTCYSVKNKLNHYSSFLHVYEFTHSELQKRFHSLILLEAK